MMPKFAVCTTEGVARAVIEGHATALRVQDHFQQLDMIPHFIRPARDEDMRLDVLRNT